MLKINALALMLFSATSYSTSGPDVNLYFQSTVIKQGQATTLNWDSPSADRCFSSSGSILPTTGSYSVKKSSVGKYQSTISCEDMNGKSYRTADLHVVHSNVSANLSTYSNVGGAKRTISSIPFTIQTDNQCHNVSSYSELKMCLDSGFKDIVVKNDAIIKIESKHFNGVGSNSPLTIPAGVKVYSYRGINGAYGATIYFELDDINKIKNSEGNWISNLRPIRLLSGSVLSGFRIIGPRLEKQCTSTTECKKPQPIAVSGLTIGFDKNVPTHDQTVSGVEISNNHIFRWRTYGVFVGEKTSNIKVSNNIIEGSNEEGYGYGILMNGHYYNSAIYNVFSNNRHDIASTGKTTQGYKAHYNIAFDGSPTISGKIMHRFDMHPCKVINNCSDGAEYGGGKLTITNNIFSFKDLNQISIAVGGMAKYPSTITYNEFSNTKKLAIVNHSDAAMWFRSYATGELITLGEEEEDVANANYTIEPNKYN